MDALKTEVRSRLERALTCLSLLHLGPVDYNIACTIDELRVAERLLEQFQADRRGG